MFVLYISVVNKVYKDCKVDRKGTLKNVFRRDQKCIIWQRNIKTLRLKLYIIIPTNIYNIVPRSPFKFDEKDVELYPC